MFSSQALSHLSGLTHPLQGAKITTNSSHFAKFAFGAHIRLSIPVSRPQYSREYWEDVKRGLDWGFGNGPDMIADCGGDIVLLISEGIEAEKLYEETGELPGPPKMYEEACSPLDFCFSPLNSRSGTLRSFIRDELKDDPSRYRRILKNLVGISQITSTGAVRILKKRADGTLFESSNIYESVTKTKFDNRYGSHISLPRGLEKAIGGPIANKNVVLCGYGDVGKDCAKALKEAGANVFVIKNNPDQNNPDHALDARMEGIQVKTLDEIVSEGDIFITTTDSKDIIAVDHMKKMKDNAVICSTGQFDNVIDMQGLETDPNVRRITVSPHANKWIFPGTNDGVIVWAGGRIMNLGSATGNPCFVESCPHVDQVIGLIELWKEKDVQNLNRERTSESFPSLLNNLDVRSETLPSLRSLRELYSCPHPLLGAKISLSPTTTTTTAKTITALGAEILGCTPNFLTHLNPAGGAIVTLKNQNPHLYWEYVKRTLDWGPNLIAENSSDLTLFIREGIKAEKMYEKTRHLPYTYSLCAEKMYKETRHMPDPYSPYVNANLQAVRTIIRNGLKSDPNKYRRMVNDLAGISQITPTGAVRILKMRDDGSMFEPINLYDSVTKTKFDNWYGSHLSLPEGLKRAIGGPIANKKVVLCGYGNFGKDSANALEEAGANVFIIKNNPEHTFDALMDGIQVKTLDEIVPVGDIFITTTDTKDIITVDHMKRMKNNAFICSTGQFDNVIDMQGLETYAYVSMITVSPYANKWVFRETNNGVIILAEGRMMNLGCASGNPNFVEPCPDTDQVIGLMELWKQMGGMKDA